jgi:hypothetical protein
MSILTYCNILLGSFSGIAAYKEQPLNYVLLGSYFSIITPIQVIDVYSRLDILAKIRLHGANPFIHVPITIGFISLGNLSIFGLGYIVGNIGYSAYLRFKN